MRKTLYLLLLMPFCALAQNMYDIFPLVERGISGTARFVGMGGSMSALGGDVSVIGTNPAGVALYRSNDLNFTASANFDNVKVKYGSDNVKSDKSYGMVNNVGFVLSNEIKDRYLKFVNFGISYRRNKDLSANFEMFGKAGGFSQQYIINALYRGCPFEVQELNYSMYDVLGYNWMALLMAEGYYDGFVKGDDFIVDKNGALLYEPDDIGFYSEERGGVDEVELNIAANFNEWLYLGMTVGLSNIDYTRYSYYYEDDKFGEIYSLDKSHSIEGHGINVKLGAIIRPFKYSPFKIGLSVHTPTWYELTESYYSTIAAVDGYIYDTRDPQRYDGEINSKHKVSTPWRFNVSASYTFGTRLALNAEYEYADYSTVEFERKTKGSLAQNKEIGRNLKAQHTFRVGAEYRIKDFSIRAGYNYQTAPFEKGAYKNMDNANVSDTSTDYINKFEKNIFTLGAGYRYKNFYIDVAYMLQIQKADFYPFYDTEYVNPAADVEFADNSIMATFGVRF